MKKIAMAFDPHGSEIDHSVANSFLEFCEWFNPEIRIIGGDLWDFACLRTGANQGDEAIRLADDWDTGCRFADRFFLGNEGGKNVLLLGNHDIRPYKKAASSTNAVIVEYCEDLVRRIEGKGKLWNAELIPYGHDGVYDLSPKWRIVHGIRCGLNALRSHVQHYSRNVIFGHVHTQGFERTQTFDRYVGITPGLIGKDRMAYANERAATLGWENGWLYGWLDEESGELDWEIAKRSRIDGKFRTAKDFNRY